MAKFMNNHSSNYGQMGRLNQESTVLASCYSVESSSTKVQGFHYCSTLGAGMLSHPLYSTCILIPPTGAQWYP